MTNLIIGLCVGIVAAVALAVMWRMAERSRNMVQMQENPTSETKVSLRDVASKTSANDS